MSRFYIFAIAFFTGFIAYSQVYDQAVKDIIDTVEQDSLVYFLRNVSGEDSVVINGEKSIISHRVDNWGNDIAANYLKGTLEGFGLTTYKQDYGASGTNIYAIQEGTVFPDEYYLICSHYDAVDMFCADDNGSGTAAVLESARIFSDLEFEYSIIYAFWDEEEEGLIGSSHYAEEAASEGKIIHSVINLDMISWDGDEDRIVEIHSSYVAGSNIFADYIVEVNNLYEFELETVIMIPGTSASDHSRFWKNDYQAVLLIEEYYGGDFNPFYHSEADRIDILDMPYFHEMTKLALAVLASKAIPDIPSSIAKEEVFQSSGIRLINYPNPFSHETTLYYYLENESPIRFSVINSMGEVLNILDEGVVQSGNNSIQLLTGNLPKGMYYLCMETHNGTVIRKITII